MSLEELNIKVLYDTNTLHIAKVYVDCDKQKSSDEYFDYCENCRTKELCDAAVLILNSLVIEKKWFELEEADA